MEKIERSTFEEAAATGQTWAIIDQKVYNIGKIIEKHPGGPEFILDIAGKDGTDVYNAQHATSETAHKSFLCPFLILNHKQNVGSLAFGFYR